MRLVTFNRPAVTDRREYNREWARRNPERVKAHRRKTYLKHREAIIRRVMEARK